jgi:drug/metabolite transporter (DMT)-like permease
MKQVSDNIITSKSASISKDVEAYTLGIISVAAFALTLPFAKVLTGHLSALQIGIFRSLLAALAALPILLVLRAPLPNRSQIKRMLITSIGIVYGFPILTALGMQYVPVSHGGVVLAALPLSTAVFGTLITKDRPPAMFWLVSIIGFITVFLFTVLRNGIGAVYFGDLALFGAVILAGLGYAQGGALSKEMSGWQVMCWTLVVSLPILLPLFIIFYDHQQIASLSKVSLGALGFLAFVNSLLAFFTWNRALAVGGIQKISQLQLLQPFITYAYSVLLMGEALDWVPLVVCAIVIALVVISKKTLSRKR